MSMNTFCDIKKQQPFPMPLLPSATGLTVCSLSRLRSPLWNPLWCISATEHHCQWPTASGVHDSALTQQPLTTIWISTWGEGLGSHGAQGCPDTSPRERSQTSAWWSCPLSALGSQEKPGQKTKMLASNSRVPRPKMHHVPVCFATVCCLRDFFFNPFASTEMTYQQFVQRKMVGWGWGGGGGKGDGYFHLIHHQFLLISHKHLILQMLREKKKMPLCEH